MPKNEELTKYWAILAMKKGKKVTHRHFSENEWITMEGFQIVTEEGYKHDATEFWQYRTDESWNNGWSIYQEN